MKGLNQKLKWKFISPPPPPQIKKIKIKMKNEGHDADCRLAYDLSWGKKEQKKIYRQFSLDS